MKALWKGNLTAEYLWIAFAAAQFATYHATVDVLPKTSNEKSVYHYLGMIPLSFLFILSCIHFHFNLYYNNEMNNKKIK